MSYEKKYIKGEDKYKDKCKDQKWEDHDSKCKEDDKCEWEDYHCHDDHKKVKDFKFDVDHPNIYNANNVTPLPVNMEIPVAAITFNKLKEDSEVLLQGLLTLQNATNTNATVIIRIRKKIGPAVGPTGEVIYQTPILTVLAQNNITIPVLHVDDRFKHDECDVSYVLTVTAFTQPLVLSSPRTFTGTEFK
ncbi:hypothetical protein [Priestia megaterium]